MFRVLKWSIDVRMGHLFLTLPAGSDVVLVGHHEGRMSRERVGIWVKVPVDSEGQARKDIAQVLRRFEVYGTGHPIAEGRNHLGSTFAGQFVWHVFEAPAK